MSRTPEQERLYRLGGEGVRLRSAQGAAHTRVIGDDQQPKLSRDTVLDMTNFVRPMRDPKLNLTSMQRAVGTYYAHCVEKSHGSYGSGDIRDIRVDGGGGGAGANMARIMDISRAAKVANQALDAMPAFTYSTRAAGHKPIHAAEFLMGVCVGGADLTSMGHAYQWVSIQRKTSKKKGEYTEIVVPWRQRQKLAQILSESLDAVCEAWDQHNIELPAQLSSIVVI